MYRERDTSSEFALGLVAGAAIGAAVAFLCAPSTGRALRRELSAGASSLREAIGSYFEEMADRAGVEMEQLRAAVEEATTAVERKASSVIGSASEAFRSVADVRRG
ncbi:MAG: YtxH domain-containing protein [Vicinamibacterales bacterium]